MYTGLRDDLQQKKVRKAYVSASSLYLTHTYSIPIGTVTHVYRYVCLYICVNMNIFTYICKCIYPASSHVCTCTYVYYHTYEYVYMHM